MKYKLNEKQKSAIVQNLINVMELDEPLLRETCTFITNWVLTGADEKTKDSFDVWNLVLLNYMPSTRPVLYRSCNRRHNGKVASFTSRIACAHKFGGNKGFLIICDTKEALLFNEQQSKGQYSHTFYSISDLLRKESKSTKSLISNRLITDYIGEEEYIMRVDLNWMYTCKWYYNEND